MMPLLPDEAVLRRLVRLRPEWRVGQPEGVIGTRRGPRAGPSREFLGVRPYEIGDDLRDLDWASSARFGRAHVRQYRQEVDASLLLLLDASASMAFGDPSKLDYARALAAALGYLGLAHHDRVGLAVFADRITASVPIARGHGHWRALRDLAAGVRPGGAAAFGEIVAALPRLHALRGAAIILSDFHPPDAFAAGLERLARSRLSVVALQVLGQEELEPTLEGEVELVDCETGETRIGVVGATEREVYRSALASLAAQLAVVCRDAGARHVRVSTGVPLLRCLQVTLVRAGVLARAGA